LKVMQWFPNGGPLLGACHNLIFCVFVLFLARFLFQSSFFSKSRLCRWPLFSHFVTNLDWLAGRLIQILFTVKICFVLVQIFYVFPRRVNPVGDNCMMMKASSWSGCQHDGSVLGMTMSPTVIASVGLTMPIVLSCLCCHRLCLASLLP
jgi:hypothetical protein